MLIINPDECIDCGVCEPECPIEAIVPDSDPSAEAFLEVNREYSQGKWPVLTRKKDPLPEAEEFKNKPNKFGEWFSPNAGEGD
jgi:ferredoxin